MNERRHAKPMASYLKKRQRRIDKTKAKAIAKITCDLEAEKAKLDFLRDSRHLWDALHAYIIQPHLTEDDRREIREALLYLTRGE